MSTDSHKDAKAQAKAAKAYAKATRPWFKKKRFWALGLILIVALSSMFGGKDSKTDTATTTTAATTAAAAAPADVDAAKAEVSKAADSVKSELAKATEKTQEAAAPAEPALVVSANKLLDDLDSNALKASQTYKGKLVTVTGNLENIDASGKYFSIGRTDGEITITSVQVYINDDQKNTVANLNKGQKVTVTGHMKDVGEILGYSLDADSIK